MLRRIPHASLLVVATASLLTGRPAQASDVIPYDVAMKERIRECGVRWSNLAITYEDVLQSYLIRIGDLGGTDEARLRCLRQVVGSRHIVEIRNPEQAKAYAKLVRHEKERWARLWLKTLGSDLHIARFEPSRGLKAFAREVEAGCWIPARRALKASGSNVLVVRPRFLGKVMTPKILHDITCLTHMVEASNADEHGIVLTFIGVPAPKVGYR